MASRRRALRAPGPTFYTAQDVARFCEVDLKTVHHWADRGKVVHHRTEGRHLRFRRNDVVRFLRAHGYPIPREVSETKVAIAYTLPAAPDGLGESGERGERDEMARKLATRFIVERYASGAVALAHLALSEPSAIVLDLADATLGGARTIAALKARPETAWVVVAALGEPEAVAAAKEAGAEVAVASRDAGKLPAELGRALAAV